MHFHKTKILALLPLGLAALGLASPSSQAWPASKARPVSHARPVSGTLEARVTLARQSAILPALSAARPLGRLAGSMQMNLALTLPLRNQSQLDELLRRLYTPGDPMQGKFLKPAEFAEKFGPTPQDYQAVADYARSQGLTVTATHPARTLLDVAGPASAVEFAFGVQLGQYQLHDGRIAYANSAPPRVPRSIAARLAGVAGLNNFGQMRPVSHPVASSGGEFLHPRLPVTGTGATIGTGPAGGLAPNDIKFAYSLTDVAPLYGTTGTGLVGTGTGTTGTGTTTTTPVLDGTGQTVGLFELDGYLTSDIALYISTYSLPTVLNPTVTTTPAPLQNVLLDGANGGIINAQGQSEATLDIDMILALAPNVKTIYVYEANGTTFPAAPADLFQRMADDTATDGTPLLKEISDSWTVPETQIDSAVRDSENTSFQQMAAQGQSVFAASGEYGAYAAFNPTTPTILTQPAVNDPASQPYVTGVGGTTLKYNKPVAATGTTAAANGQYVSETVWKSGTLASVGGPSASGGGTSELWTKPDYQAGLGASPLRRDVPDVALNADPNTGYDIFLGGTVATLAGTSAAAPLWASFTALVNQQRALNGLTTTLGFANPPLYTIGRSQSYTADFHDVTLGDNLYFPAEVGFDDATGFGSFIGDTLIAALAFNADQGSSTATLSGVVTDTSGVGIANATVTAVSNATSAVKATTVTDSSGAYTLTVPGALALNVTVNTSTVAPLTDINGNPINYAGQTVTNLTLAASDSVTQNFILDVAHTFAAGLQMISAPYDFTSIGGDFATLFGLTTPLTNPNPRLIQWEPLLGSYVFYPTAPADTLRPGQGYWIKFPTANYLHFEGAAVPTTQSFQITLQPGWNQIGDPFLSSAPLSGVTVSASAGGTAIPLTNTANGLVQSTLYRYDMSAGAYVALSPATDTLDPYNGYWIFAAQTAVLSIPPETAPPPPVVPVIP